MMNGNKTTTAKHKPTKPQAMEDMIVLIGDEAWTEYQNGKGTSWLMLNENILKNKADFKPFIIGKNQLDNLGTLRIFPSEQRAVKFYVCGEPLTELQKTALCFNLATNTKANAVGLYDLLGNLTEKLSGEIERIRQEEQKGGSVAKMIVQATEKRREAYVEYRDKKDKNGLFFIKPRLESGEVVGETEQWICDNLEFIGKGKNENGEYYYIFQWQNDDERTPRQEAIICGEFGTESAWKRLKDKGLKMAAKLSLTQNLVEHFHAQSSSVQNWTVTHSTGWINDAYLLPNGDIIGEPCKPILFQNKSASSGGYDTKGTLESWQKEIAFYVNKNTSMMLGVAVALASPLLRLINAKSFGVHLFNSSSKGKTTTLNIANSIYGDPDKIDLSWNTTPTALSNEASSRNDGFITLDELGQAKKIYDVENIAYSLFNEKGRAKGIKEGGNEELNRWKITALSTGEKDVEGFLKSKGVDINAGQLVRLLNIPLIEASHLHGLANNKAHADHLNDAAFNHYGVIGREWINFILANKDRIKAEFQRYKDLWLERLAENTASQVQRVATNFAILETALQLAQHLTLWSESDNRECLIKSFNDWLADYGTGDREEAKIIEFFNSWLERNAESKFIQIPEEPNRHKINDIFGYRILEVLGLETEHFYIHTGAFNSLIKESGYPKKLVFEKMELHKMLRQGKEKERPYQHKIPKTLENLINSKGKRFYLVYPYLEDDNEE